MTLTIMVLGDTGPPGPGPGVMVAVIRDRILNQSHLSKLLGI